jgi:cytochrome c2
MNSERPGNVPQKKGDFIQHSWLLLIFGIPFLLECFSSNALGQVKAVSGNAARGAHVLFDKGCLNCHGLNGNASDLSRTPRNAVTPEALAGEMWNHMPQMWLNGRPGLTTPLTSTEAADLFAYLYSTLYFAFPGSASRGRSVFERKNCADCHNGKTVGEAGTGLAVSAWAPVGDPVIWAERMWNHSPDMNDAATRKGLRWPTLSSQDIADLFIYLRNLPELRAKSGTFRMGEPGEGKLVFERACQSCHSFGPGSGDVIDLLGRPFPLTVTGFIATMWNHAPAMQSKSGEHFPVLRSGEMSDLISFLFSESYFLKRGDAAQGRFVFETKKCARCHEERRQETGAPDLGQASEPYSPITLISAVWRHGSEMSEMMRQNAIPWPRFQNSEMADLIAYLNRNRKLE